MVWQSQSSSESLQDSRKATQKIIYFDSETIGNMLQKENKGLRHTQIATTISAGSEGNVGIEAKVSLGIPLWERIMFAASGKVSASYLANWSKKTSLTKTKISEFEDLREKANFKPFNSVIISDILNSSTVFRTAAVLLRMYKGEAEDVDVKMLSDVMDAFDGYDTYKIDNQNYVRFNTEAFVSNYKRNDLLNSKIDMYCTFVGEFENDQFDYFKKLAEMERVISSTSEPKSLSDIFLAGSAEVEAMPDINIVNECNNKVRLYDVVFAAISSTSEVEHA